VVVVLERDPGALQAAVPLHEHLRMAVDQDVVDGRIGQQRLERPQPEDLVDDLVGDEPALRRAQRRDLLVHEIDDQRPDPLDRRVPAEPVERLEIQSVEDRPVQAGLELLELGARRNGGRLGRSHHLRLHVKPPRHPRSAASPRGATAVQENRRG
jgi:hypothetical protein